jgi:chemotaxis protein CheX
MQFSKETILQIAGDVWNLVLEMDIEPSDTVVIPAVKEGFVTGCVNISGAWEGTVVLDCSADMAKQAAVVMFEMELDEIGEEEINDAVGELANMLGGNIKSLLPEPCKLSLPVVVQGNGYSTNIPGSESLAQAAFLCQGQPIQAMLLQQNG